MSGGSQYCRDKHYVLPWQACPANDRFNSPEYYGFVVIFSS